MPYRWTEECSRERPPRSLSKSPILVRKQKMPDLSLNRGWYGAGEFDDDQPSQFTNRASIGVGKIGTGIAVRGGRVERWSDGEKSAALLQLVLTNSIGEETELADADHSGG